MKIFLVRHAEGEGTGLNWQTPKTTLSERGVKQAEILASRLSKFKVIDLILTSDWTRAQQTTEIIRKTINKPVSVVEEIHERQQSSKIYGLSRTSPLAEQYWSSLIKNRNDWNYKWDNEEESSAELIKRTIGFKENLIKNYSQKSVLVISHESFLSGLVTTSVLGNKFNNTYFKNLFKSIAIENTGLSLLIYREEQKTWKLWYLNDYSHLGSL